MFFLSIVFAAVSVLPADRMAMAGRIVLDRQSVITKIPEFVAQDIIDIWKMQIILTNEAVMNDQEQIETVVWKEIFRAGLEFLMNRVHMDENLERIITFWTDTYYNHIPQSLRTRKALVSSNKARNQESRNSRSEGVRTRRNASSGKRSRTRKTGI